MKNCILFIMFFSVLVFARSNEKNQFYNMADDSIDLESKWNAAMSSTKAIESNFWIIYSITRIESRNTTICSHRHKSSGVSLEEFIYGTKTIRESAEDALNEFDSKDEEIPKEMVILLRFNQSQNLKMIEFSDIHDTVDLDNYPVYWLGNISNQMQSINFLKEQYAEDHSTSLKEELVSVIGLHQTQPDVSNFLRSVIESDIDNEVRENAVFWLGIQNRDSDAQYLKDLVDGDDLMKIREKAVFAIGLIDTDAAIDYLIDIAKNSESNKLRKESIFWLGQKASERSSSELENIVYSDEDLELKEQAVFALSQLADGEGVDTLIEIAQNHPSIDIRKKAIFWLGQSGDPRALDLIISFLDNK